MLNDRTAPVTASDASLPIDDPSFLRAVLEAIPPFVARLDPELRISYINHLRPGGLTLRELIGRPAHEFIAPEDLEKFDRAVEHALRTGERCSYLARGASAVTSIGAVHYEAHAVPIDHGDGRRAVCIIATDVSEQVARANALQASEEQLRIAVEATGIGLWTWDLTSDHIEWNQRMIDIVGSGPLSTPDYVERIVHPDDRAHILAEIANVTAGQPNFVEHRIVRPDGELRWLLPCGRLITDELGRVVRVTGGTLDVTAQRMTDERLRNVQKLEAVGSLTAGIAHNFNNMLAIMLPALEIAQHAAAPSQSEMLGEAVHAARRASELVAQLMTFAGQRRAPTAEPHDLAVVLERALSMTRRTFERQVRIDTTIDDGCCPVACDPSAIEQVVLNLMINARDAVLEAERVDPRIEVDLSETASAHPDVPNGPRKQYVRIRVKDNGTGMSETAKQRLFEPFFTTKGPGRGTGLGLATSYGIVRDHGGFMMLESQLGAGSTLAVFLPCVEVTAATVEAPAAVAPVRIVRSGTILVVDDEPGVRRVVKLLLAAHGHHVHEAADGLAAVAALDAGLRPDLILLDRSIPGWPARVTLDELRKRAAHTPIVFFTGQAVPRDERALVQDVLHKPLSNDELVGAVEQWLPET